MQPKKSIAPKESSKNSKEAQWNLLWNNLARKIVLLQFEKLEIGQLILEENRRSISYGRFEPDFPIFVTIKVLNSKMFFDIAAKGLNGAAEAYFKGWWTCSDLTQLVQLFVRNRNMAENLESGLAWAGTMLFKLQHALRRNGLQGSFRNIRAHYDLGDEFFETFLDSTKMYSCGIFKDERSSLYDASLNKIKRICKKLELSEKDQVLEIGTGWGGFALYAATHIGCHITTTTISEKQYKYTRKKVHELGLQERIKVIKKDYRELKGQFDKLVSIEMIEAVGHHYYNIFFQTCNGLLKPHGRMLLQGIIITDYLYEEAKRFADFIKTYIFPGSCIPSIGVLCRAAGKTTDMRLFHLEDITPHYAKTLSSWRNKFLENIEKIRDLGYSEEFINLWVFYFCYCEGGFLERQIGVVQMLFTKPLCRMSPILPDLIVVVRKPQT